jgi:hypothetical protein
VDDFRSEFDFAALPIVARFLLTTNGRARIRVTAQKAPREVSGRLKELVQAGLLAGMRRPR